MSVGRSSRAAAFTTSLIAALVSTPSVGQSSPPLIGHALGTKTTSVVYKKFLICLYNRYPIFAVRLLDTIPGTSPEKVIANRIMSDAGSCIDFDHVNADEAEVILKPNMLRRGFAEVSIRRTGSDLPILRPAQMTETPLFGSQSNLQISDLTIDQTALAALSFGHCVAYNDWAESIRLIRSTPSSLEENSAVTALQPALAPCLAQGSTIKVNRSMLRATLAEAVWHVIKPSPVVASAVVR